MKTIFIALILLFEISSAQWITLKPSNNIYVSEGGTKSLSNYTGTLGLHYFLNDNFGVSLQTNFINDIGWYHDFSLVNDDIKVIFSIGYSAVYNSSSFSLRIGIRLKRFYY